MSGYTGIVDAVPPFVPGTFDGQDVRLATMLNATPGIFESGDFAVTQRGAGANMSVDIAAGRCIVSPGAVSRQGNYVAWMGTTYNTSSDGAYTWTAADATNARIDLVCIEAADTDFSGSYTGFKFRIVDGTPSASATHQLEANAWPAIPSGCVPIAAVRVPALATTLTTTNITSLNPIGGFRSQGLYVATAETTTSATFARLATPDFVMVYLPTATSLLDISAQAHAKMAVSGNTQASALFIDGAQTKSRTAANTPAVFEQTSTAVLTTTYSGVASGLSVGAVGSSSDVSDVATGQVALQRQNGATASITGSNEVFFGLPVGWHICERRYKTGASTLTLRNRYMWAKVIG